MSWETFKVEEQRQQLIEAYINGDASMTYLCEKFGISRKTGLYELQNFLIEAEKKDRKEICESKTKSKEAS